MAIPAAQGGRGIGAWGPEMEFLKSDGAWAHGIDPKKPLSPLEFFRIYAGHYAVLLYAAIVVMTGALAIKLATSWWQFCSSFDLRVLPLRRPSAGQIQIKDDGAHAAPSPTPSFPCRDRQFWHRDQRGRPADRHGV